MREEDIYHMSYSELMTLREAYAGQPLVSMIDGIIISRVNIDDTYNRKSPKFRKKTKVHNRKQKPSGLRK